MAVLFCDSYERKTIAGDGGTYPWEAQAILGGVTSPVRTGSRASPNGFSRSRETFFGRSSDDYGISNGWFSFYFRRTASMTNNTTVANFLPASGGKLILRTTATPQFKLVDSTGTDIATGSTTLAIDTWYRVDVRFGTGTSAPYELRVHADGAPGTTLELSGNADLGTDPLAYFTCKSGSVSTFTAEDVVLESSGYIANGNDYRIETIFPNAQGEDTAWTGDYTDVDDVDHDATTTEITTNTVDNTESVDLGSIGTLAATESVIGVFNVYHCRKTSNPDTFAALTDRISGGSIRVSSDFALQQNDTDFAQIRTVWLTTRPGGGAFTESDINAYEIGIRHRQAQSRDAFCTAMNCNVLIDMPAAGGITYSQLERNFVRGRNRGIMKGVS